MKAVEAVKEKFYCFLGIVHPTYYQSRGWGPWLIIHAFQKQDLFKLLYAISLDVVNRKTYCIVYIIVLWAHEDGRVAHL